MKPEVAQLLHTAQAAMQRRDAATAARALEQALGIEPEGLEVNLMAGDFAAQTMQIEPAIACFRTVLQIDPNRQEALNGLAFGLHASGRSEEALPFAEKACKINPRDPGALNTLGLICAQTGKVQEAADAFSRATQLAPQVGLLHRNLGEMLERLNRPSDAIESYKRAYELDPQDVEARMSAAGLMMVHGRLEEATGQVKRVLADRPDFSPAILLSARLHSERRMSESAERDFQRALAADPDSALAYGIWLIEEGRLPQASEILRAYLQRHPDHPIANYWLAESRGLKDPSDPISQTLEALADRPLDANNLSFVHFGLGRMFDRAKEYERAIHHLDEANRLAYAYHFPTPPDLKSLIGDEVDLARSRFGRAEIERRQLQGNPSNRPIFIVGMIRSGTTLLEQIVASHPAVAGAGELRFWMENASQAWRNPETYPQLAGRYLEILKSVSEDAPRVTDKAPLNYRFLGPLRAAFPNAKFLHIRRNPIDTCLSIYMMAHTKPPPFAHSQRNIVANYRYYEQMMEHWRLALPEGSLYEVAYEDLVSDQEAKTREIIGFLGLEWDDACLKPEENASAVRTPSLMQVRQPVYRTSVERWRNYEPWLRELLELRA